MLEEESKMIRIDHKKIQIHLAKLQSDLESLEKNKTLLLKERSDVSKATQLAQNELQQAKVRLKFNLSISLS